MNDAVKISDLTKRYGNLTALDGINFNVAKGELFGLIGPDGAGKSSLYKILATLSHPDSGSAVVCGFDTVREFKQIRDRIGYMPERFSLYPDLTVSENLKFFASLFGVSIKKNFDLIAPIFGQLEKFPNRKAGALSGGMKQKLALSCALIHRPELLLLDEPTTGVDAISRNEFWDILSGLKEKGITILVSTSYMEEATKCERIAMINDGRILDIDTPERLVSRLGENLYDAVATDMFGLLNKLRSMSGVINCYTFGATLHVVADNSFNAEKTERELADFGLHDVHIYPAHPTIEDLFIKETYDEQ